MKGGGGGGEKKGVAFMHANSPVSFVAPGKTGPRRKPPKGGKEGGEKKGKKGREKKKKKKKKANRPRKATFRRPINGEEGEACPPPRGGTLTSPRTTEKGVVATPGKEGEGEKERKKKKRDVGFDNTSSALSSAHYR